MADQIYLNNISAGTAGSYGIFVFAPYTTVSVHDNTVATVAVGLAAFGGFGGTAAFSNNTVSVNSNGTGAFVTTDQLGFGSGNVSATFNGDKFTGNAGTGTGIEVDQQAGFTSTAGLTGVKIQTFSTGVDVTGGSASVQQSTITGNSVGIKAETGGKLTSASQNFINTNTTGISIAATAGAIGSIFNNDLSGNTTAVSNSSATVVDASGNWFGDSEAGVVAKVSPRTSTTPRGSISGPILRWAPPVSKATSLRCT